MIFEIFRQERKGQPFAHAGLDRRRRTRASRRSMPASSTAGAGVGRAVARAARGVHEIDEFPDEFDLKYRRVDGYSIKTRLREARERAGTLETSLS